LIEVPIVNETLPHDVSLKYGAAKIMLMPAPKGTGLKSGGPVRVVLELAGVPNAVSKLLGSSNKINNARATFKALELMKISPEQKAATQARKQPAKKAVVAK
jgi:small subunit ribosomal protein S5